MAKMNVRKGDTVEVLSGKDKGVRAEVIKAMPAEGKVVVRGVAVVKKAQRPTQANQEGGIVEKEAATPASATTSRTARRSASARSAAPSSKASPIGLQGRYVIRRTSLFVSREEPAVRRGKGTACLAHM